MPTTFTKADLHLIKDALDELARQYREDLKEPATELNRWRLDGYADRLNEIRLLTIKVWRAEQEPASSQPIASNRLLEGAV